MATQPTPRTTTSCSVAGYDSSSSIPASPASAASILRWMEHVDGTAPDLPPPVPPRSPLRLPRAGAGGEEEAAEAAPAIPPKSPMRTTGTKQKTARPTLPPLRIAAAAAAAAQEEEKKVPEPSLPKSRHYARAKAARERQAEAGN